MRSSIKSVGMHVPSGVLTNQDLERMVETSNDWIVARTGITERRIVASGETPTSLAADATRRALADAGLRPTDIDLLIFATSSPDSTFPPCGVQLAERVGITAPAFDLMAACSGFLYGLSVADRYISTGAARNVVVVGSETLSRIIDYTDRGTCIVFGDGAGAVVVGPASDGGGILSCVWGADGTGADLINLGPGTPQPEGPGHPVIRMEGRKVFRFATDILCQATEQALAKAGLTLADVALIVPHQANARIIEAAGKRLGVPSEKLFINIGRYGNTSTATIPIALREALDAGRIYPGANVVLVGFGSGLTWGACVICWESQVSPGGGQRVARTVPASAGPPPPP
jgi:3-oxoacyl-[acyl-carrier-protein] synthase-3